MFVWSRFQYILNTIPEMPYGLSSTIVETKGLEIVTQFYDRCFFYRTCLKSTRIASFGITSVGLLAASPATVVRWKGMRANGTLVFFDIKLSEIFRVRNSHRSAESTNIGANPAPFAAQKGEGQIPPRWNVYHISPFDFRSFLV